VAALNFEGRGAKPMTKTTMRSMLRMAIFGGAVALSPALALADTGTDTGPDHATAEAHSDQPPTDVVPDHATAERAGPHAATVPSGLASCACTPDHATAQARGAQSE
jgi:hypothetical protein